MNTQGSAAAPPPRPRPPTRRRRDARGLATLEWLLLVAAAGGFTASMSAGLDHLIADQITPTQPDARIAYVESRLTAARINDRSAAALAALHSARADDATDRISALEAQLDRFRHDCENLADAYPEAIRRAIWHWLPIPLAFPPTAHDSSVGNSAPARADEADDDAAADPTDVDGRWVCAVSGPAE
ncbi:hypothetical protein [Candidatus Poriferisodalis sp.]|uniref:hypothetical protein n=1 Tax=Candidatus Poriferisodalis sp. TaxID=3101277 RepID=UPI003B024DBA